MAMAMGVGNFLSASAPNFATLLIVRFLTGLPHGAYFGVAARGGGESRTAVTASFAMAVVFAGLTVANIVGVPLATLIGQHAGWRVVYALVGMIELLAAIAVISSPCPAGAGGAGACPSPSRAARLPAAADLAVPGDRDDRRRRTVLHVQLHHADDDPRRGFYPGAITPCSSCSGSG